MKLKKIKNHSGYARDMNSSAIVNINHTAYNAAKLNKERRLKEKRESIRMRKEIDELKSLLNQILNNK